MAVATFKLITLSMIYITHLKEFVHLYDPQYFLKDAVTFQAYFHFYFNIPAFYKVQFHVLLTEEKPMEAYESQGCHSGN